MTETKKTLEQDTDYITTKEQDTDSITRRRLLSCFIIILLLFLFGFK